MCSPENNLPKDVLSIEFEQAEIESISNAALLLFRKKLNLLNSAAIELNLSETERRLIFSLDEESRGYDAFSKGYLVKKLDYLYSVLSEKEEAAKNSDDYELKNKLLSKISICREQLDIYLLWLLFDLTKIFELMEYIPLKSVQILKYYAKCCDTAIKKKLSKESQQLKLEKCRNFLLDSAEWISFPANSKPAMMKKKYPHYENEIHLIKKSIKYGWYK